MSQMRRLDCDICLQDIEDLYDTTVNIIEHNQRLLSMAAGNPHGAKLLASGRVVILRDGVSKRRFLKQYIGPVERLTEFFSTSNITSECCLNLRRRILPWGPRCTTFWRSWILTRSLEKMVR